jgi:hypothetical protein
MNTEKKEVHYFTKVTHSTQTKNKLEKAVYTLFTVGFDRRIIHEQFLAKYKAIALEQIEVFNQIHKNCKPIEAKWWQASTKDGDWHLNLPFLNFVVYKQNVNYELPNPQIFTKP